MSVINRMLRDLDKRQAPPAPEGDSVRAVKPASRWQVDRPALTRMAIVAALSLGAMWWLQSQPSPPPPVVQAPPPPVIAAAVQATPVAAEPAAAASNATAAAAASVAEAGVAMPAGPARKPPVQVAQADPSPQTAPAPATPAQKSATMITEKAEAALAAPDRPAATPARPVAAKSYSDKQQAANLLAEAQALEQQGRQEEAKTPLQRVLAGSPHDLAARQMLVQLQMDTGRSVEARRLLEDGLRLHPGQPVLSQQLARLQVDAGDTVGALQTLESASADAASEPQYNAFMGALLLRQQRYDDAVQRYLVALRTDPANVSWLVGVGVALEGAGKPRDAAEAYRRADAQPNVSADVSQFISTRLARLPR